MKAIKKIIVLLLMGAMSSTSISGCSMAELIPEMNVTFLMQPLHLSRTSDLYVSEDHIMTSIGENILDTAHNNEESFIEASEAAISSENNSENISCVTSIQPESEQELTQRLVAEWVSEDEINTEPKTFSVKFNTYPSNTINKSIIIESADPNAVYFPYDENADRIIEPMLKPMDNALPEIAVEADEDGAFEVSLIGTAEGDFPLTARNVLGDEIGKFSISLIPGYIGVAMDNQTVQDEKVVHEHVFQDQVIPATFQEQGFTQHSCNICGYTFRDCYTAKVECSHEYIDKVIPPSYSVGGYTIHTCTLCGESYTDTYTDLLVCSHLTTNDTVIPPTCNDSGYTIHECAICRNYTTIDSYVNALGHEWDSGLITVQPGCGSYGTKIYTCCRCGESMPEQLMFTNEHQFHSSVVEPTHESGGYTLHVCSVCGYSFCDEETEPLSSTIEAKQEAETPQMEIHNFCKDCGIDFHGWSQSQIWDHCAAHIEEDENSKGGYYSKTVIVS